MVEVVVRNDNYPRCMCNRKLLLRDLLGRLAKYVRVLQRDVRKQHDLRVDHVRRVEPAAETGLDHRDVDVTLRELRERGGGEHLELGCADGLGVWLDPRDGAFEIRLVAVDPDPLAPADRK